MIISASRRTDLPAFYSKWFMNRIRAGSCIVPNPFRPDQISHVLLTPEHVDLIVFWTRHPRPLIPFLSELDDSGFRYYFLYTVMNNPRIFDTKTPSLETAIRTFQTLSDKIGPDRVIWRYDPIVLSNITGADFHRKMAADIASALKGYTFRMIISFVELYRKVRKKLDGLMNTKGIILADQGIMADFQQNTDAFEGLLMELVNTAHKNNMEIFSCAQDLDLTPYGIHPGKCIDGEYISTVFGLDLGLKKDPSQRKNCRCVVSKDIGMYDSCLFGCQYCYAASSFEKAKRHYHAHDPESPSLIPL